LLRSFVKFQLVAHLLHGCSESFNLLLLARDQRLVPLGFCILFVQNEKEIEPQRQPVD
jgi:hypothetical protein